MNISFDLDDTLIPAQRHFATEPMNWLQHLLGVEPIRLGAIELMKQLKSEGHGICIYTTSFRMEFSIRLAFWTYGVVLREVINQSKHDHILKEKRNLYSKYPPAFHIDLHVDDSPGLAIEGRRFNFRTVIIEDDTINWMLTVRQAVQK
jgi:hypothetical protein